MENLKKRLKNGEMVFGVWNSIPSSSLVNVIGKSGVDFVVIDCEHGPTSIETAENLVRALELCNTSSIIRVPSNESYLILHALDIGACGVQVPHVSTKEEAAIVVKYSKYGPLGERGFSPFTRAGQYGLEAQNHAQKSNNNTMVVVNVEGVEGVKNLKEIASVDGVDVVFIGPYDLSQSLGKPGQVDAADVIDSIKKSVDILKETGVACGSFARDMEYLDILIDCGVQYITYGVDSNLIMNAFGELKHAFDKKIGKIR